MNAILLSLVILVSLVIVYIYYFSKEGFYSLGRCNDRDKSDCESTLDDNNNSCEYVVDCYDPTDRNPACLKIKNEEKCVENKDCIVKKYSKRCQVKQDHIQDIVMDESTKKMFEKDVSKDKCTFVPWGPSKDACINRCTSTDRVYWGGDSCLENCEEICDDCKDSEKCSWLKDELKQSQDSIIPEAPDAHTIKVLPGNNKILVMWKSIDKKVKNTGFIIQYYKKYKPEFGTFSIKIPASTNKNYKHIIKNADNNDYYSVILYATNSFGAGKPSNVVTIVPNENSKLVL